MIAIILIIDLIFPDFKKLKNIMNTK